MVHASTPAPKSPARIAAGQRNRQLRGPLTDVGLVKLREAAHKYQPWKFSTGPRTPAGKARVALNGRARQTGKYSVRQKRAMAAEISALINSMAALRRQALQKEESS